ncbi:hypothetical protein [Nocardiopsis synnemataformans]|uniref:hypothetical protein n=1 Tax=Nocardiopsis synnemataformans TaxID=61305 RepID=UPI003EBB5A7B
MDITREEKHDLILKVREAVGAGLESGRMPEAPPMPPSEAEINKAAEWAVVALTRFLARKHWDNLQARERLEGEVRRLKRENARLRKVNT